ncbi:hypothetical protein QGN29_02220 [Temperatibacter marinus]|uniref:Glycosyltransferase n=1 Tax=Temperatibacter marinus TaxID=1456591 RepID=A0AA52ED04_9PROT|nr:hypothetical protein [Temperatibacter marinus]WND03182.1 hypothetical protein QGN29_02220 [Temperatibacter marinus]
MSKRKKYIASKIPVTAEKVLEISHEEEDIASLYRMLNPTVVYDSLSIAAYVNDQDILSKDELLAVLSALDLSSYDTIILSHLFEFTVEIQKLIRGLLTLIKAETTLLFEFLIEPKAGASKKPLMRLSTDVRFRHFVNIDGMKKFLEKQGVHLYRQKTIQANSALSQKFENCILVAQKQPSRPLIHAHQMVYAKSMMTARYKPWVDAINSIPNISAQNHIKPTVIPRTSVENKLMIIQRQLAPDRERYTRMMQRIYANNWMTIAEWDDHPGLLPEGIVEMWHANPWHPMTSQHAVQVSTQRLKDVISEHHPYVYLMPNALHQRQHYAEKPLDKLHIVVAALHRDNANSLIIPALEAAMAHEHVHLHVVNNAGLHKALKRYEEKITLYNYLSYQEYKDLLRRCHICLSPLEGTPTEQCKTDLKFQECSNASTVFIGSPCIYQETVNHGTDGFIARSQEEWTQLLMALLNSPEQLHAVSKSAWDAIGHRLQSALIKDRVAVYYELFERREEMTRKLHERHPELKI